MFCRGLCVCVTFTCHHNYFRLCFFVVALFCFVLLFFWNHCNFWCVCSLAPPFVCTTLHFTVCASFISANMSHEYVWWIIYKQQTTNIKHNTKIIWICDAVVMHYFVIINRKCCTIFTKFSTQFGRALFACSHART